MHLQIIYYQIFYIDKVLLMISIILACICVLSILTPVQPKDTYYNFQLSSTAFYKCLKQEGMGKIIVQIDSKVNNFVPWEVQNAMNARNSGLNVEAFYTACSSRSPEQQVGSILKQFSTTVIRRFWILLSTTSQKQCSFKQKTPAQNCEYAQKLISSLNTYNILTGIIAERNTWIQTFGTELGCAELRDQEMWWIPTYQQSDNLPNFDNYKQIGGWKKPYMKTYQSASLCGVQLINSYHE